MTQVSLYIIIGDFLGYTFNNSSDRLALIGYRLEIRLVLDY
jgi:hypothetical protein